MKALHKCCVSARKDFIVVDRKDKSCPNLVLKSLNNYVLNKMQNPTTYEIDFDDSKNTKKFAKDAV
jgi:hypothetical protein